MAQKRGYILKVGSTAHFLIASQLGTELTVNIRGKVGDSQVLPGDLKQLRGMPDGLYRCSFMHGYMKAYDGWFWSTSTIKPVDAMEEVTRLRELASGKLKLWRTKAPGIMGEIEKETFARAGAIAKRHQTEMLLWKLEQLLGIKR